MWNLKNVFENGREFECELSAGVRAPLSADPGSAPERVCP
jgi:hypothetical protein